MSQDTVRVRVAGSQFRYDREQYTEGDELDVHEGALEKHPRTLERVDDETTAEDDTEETDTEPAAEDDGGGDDAEGEGELTVDDLDPHPEDLTVPELEDRIEDVTDIELLETILEAEEARGDDTRSTATDAIEARISDLED